MLTLPPSHSVYALDVDPVRRLVFAGTRAGTIEIVSVPEERAIGEPRRVRRLMQGAPVVCVSLVGDST